jgi:UDP-GlcNAc:undecaprenyl-phosphate GlcNAc-1-phosphate transferase
VRKIHDVATPAVGGAAIFVALLITSLFLSDIWAEADRKWLFAGSFFMLIAGLADDIAELGPLMRLLLQTGACCLMIALGGVVLTDLGPLFSMADLELTFFSAPITIFAALGVINAFNMIDGMDGLGGSIFLVASTGMALFAFAGQQSEMALFLLMASAAVAAFLLLNARFPWNAKARVFMGNSGSMMLGFILAWFFISAGNGERQIFMPMTAVWLFAVPLLDTSTLIWSRWRQGQSALAADNQHLHHAFLRAGFSVEATWLCITSLALFLALLGAAIEISSLPRYLSFYIFMLVAFIYYFYLRHSWKSQRFLGRHFVHHDFTIEESYSSR